MRTRGWMVAGMILMAGAPQLAVTESMPEAVKAPLAVGYWGNEHVSIRYWTSATMALDAGVGFQFVSNANRFDFQVGVPIVLRAYPSLLLEVRPSFELSTRQNVSTDFSIMVGLLAEWFLPGTDNRLSISGGPNFGLAITSPTAGAGTTTVGTGSTNLFMGGLHFYF